MSNIKLALIAGFMVAGLSVSAQAMPVANLGATKTAATPQEARWICNGYGRCWWRPNRFYRPYAYYGGPRRFYGGPRYYGPRWRYRHW